MKFPVLRNDAAQEQSIQIIHRNSCSVARCRVLLKKCVSIHWEMGKLWCKEVTNRCSIIVQNYRSPILVKKWADHSIR